MNTIAIKTKSMMQELVSRGYKLLNVTPSREDNTKHVYIFERTDELIATINEVSNQKKLENKLTDYEIDYIKSILMNQYLNILENESEVEKINNIADKLNKMKSTYKDISKLETKQMDEILAKLKNELFYANKDYIRR